MASPPESTSPSSAPINPAVAGLKVDSGSRPRSESQLAAPRSTYKRGTSIEDGRWRTSSFSEPGRVIVIAVDASENSKFAFDYYLRNIHRPDDLIVVAHIPEPPKLPNFTFKGGFNIPADKWKAIMDEARTKTEKLESDYEDTCIHKKLHYKVRGECNKNAGETLCRIADEEGGDMVVMGCRGLGAIKRNLLGSTSDFVVRNAGRPVLVIPRHS